MNDEALLSDLGTYKRRVARLAGWLLCDGDNTRVCQRYTMPLWTLVGQWEVGQCKYV